MAYIPHTPDETREMLSELKKDGLNELFSSIPAQLLSQSPRLEHKPLSEYEVIRKVKGYARDTVPASSYNAFIGGGCYTGYVPSIVNHIASKPEFYTAYTPYQPEISQGILQSIYEYQSFICLLTGMDVTSASMYDGASATAEAILMGQRLKPAKKVLIAQSVHPEYQAVIKSYLQPLSIRVNTIPWGAQGRTDGSLLRDMVSSEYSSVVIQTPNFLGMLEDIEEIAKVCKEKNVLLIVTITNPLSLGLFKLPAGCVDIVCGNGGPLGGYPYWGGDTFGFIAAQERFLRNLPGRIVGRTIDKNNTPCFVLTLQAREQHIKREHATSNICSNQALNALKAAVYLSTVGEEGFKKVSSANFYNAHYLKETLQKECAASVAFPLGDCFFNEFVMELHDRSVPSFYAKCLKHNILPGLMLKPYFRKLKNALLVCATETKTKKELDAFVTACKQILL